MKSFLCCCVAWLFFCESIPADEPDTIAISDVLVIEGASRGGRTPFPIDPIAASIVAGTWAAPVEGAILKTGERERTWQRVAAADDGAIKHQALRGGYAFATVESDISRVMMLEATGHGMAYVNGAPRVGDPYGYGFVRLPVALHAGKNELLFQVGRGELRAKLTSPRKEVFIDTSDVTLPDLVAGRAFAPRYFAGVVVVNATQDWLRGATVGVADDEPTDVPPIPPCSAFKVPFTFLASEPHPEAKASFGLELRKNRGGDLLDHASLAVDVAKPGAAYKRTFQSTIDGSVQYYGVVPPAAQDAPNEAVKPGLLLTLHGAGVEGIGQARVYASKPGIYVIAPTNRRPYGFDWEDWGRLDAIEVLDDAYESFDTDPRRTWLTGHSMGGHGTWHLGVTFPDRFAAIAPSAGWVSMFSYAGARRAATDDPIAALLDRCTTPSDTLGLMNNLSRTGVYVLHGDADDNVPVGQARTMRKALSEFHADFAYYERPGAGHWWGNECCDWPPLVEFLTKHERPKSADIARVDFVTVNPTISPRCDWAVVASQQRTLAQSSVHLKRDLSARRIEGTTDNVASMRLYVDDFGSGRPLTLAIDGQELTTAPLADGKPSSINLTRRDDKWALSPTELGRTKGPLLFGPFREAFNYGVTLVVGTHGSAEENAWALAKARYDSESFWYRGNGSLAVITDDEYESDAARYSAHNIVLYGHAEMNTAWSALGDSPIDVKRGRVMLGERTVEGDDLACVFLYPKHNLPHPSAMVGVIAGTGLRGLRATDRLPYFTSGVAYPDWTVFGADAWEKGIPGVRAAGFFGNDWKLESGETVIREGAAPR